MITIRPEAARVLLDRLSQWEEGRLRWSLRGKERRDMADALQGLAEIAGHEPAWVTTFCQEVAERPYHDTETEPG